MLWYVIDVIIIYPKMKPQKKLKMTRIASLENDNYKNVYS